MRSVVVVLPASMWAMIPILRMFSRAKVRGMVFGRFGWFAAGVCGTVLGGSDGLHPGAGCGHEKGPCGPSHDAPVGKGLVSIRSVSPLRRYSAPGWGHR